MKQISRRVPEELAAGPDEISEAIESLTDVQLLKLEKYARWRIRGLGQANDGRDYEDLMQEAITSTLTGPRQWNKSVSFERHFIGAMRSISSHWREQFDPDSPQLESEVIRISQEGKETNLFLNALSTDPPAERALIARQDIEEIEKHFVEDREALDVIGGWRSEMTGPEIQEVLGISKTAYETIARRVRRNAPVILGQKTETKQRG
jgi:DNA-directed RNA polymerase specialized sigma24 family protein